MPADGNASDTEKNGINTGEIGLQGGSMYIEYLEK